MRRWLRSPVLHFVLIGGALFGVRALPAQRDRAFARDPHQPRLQGSRLSLFRHYVNLAGTEGKLVSLLRDFRFAPVREVIQRYTAPENIHQVDAPVEASPWGAPANGIS
jgi:hypothetical protein